MKPPVYKIARDGNSPDGTLTGYGVQDKDGIFLNAEPFEYKTQAVAFRNELLKDWQEARNNDAYWQSSRFGE